ncbi:hypothetical protein ACIBCT_40340 [Streptosporangium sp. NPDC050855]|uniref:hypothetical protein n=1 Tax=Streptosporangium sp. NPDC050855 TaxID=3366194 RepID=UPI0037B05293
MSTRVPPSPCRLARDLERAHGQGVGAASAGLRDAALGAVRLTGSAVPLLAEAAVSSATPFLRAPLLARISAVLLLHVPGQDGRCASCGVPAPCPTTHTLRT